MVPFQLARTCTKVHRKRRALDGENRAGPEVIILYYKFCHPMTGHTPA
jgi:hypothetical protein